MLQPRHAEGGGAGSEVDEDEIGENRACYTYPQLGDRQHQLEPSGRQP